MIGRESEEKTISNHLLSGNVIQLKGEQGLGKTSLLKLMDKKINGLKGFDAHYFSAFDGFNKVPKIFSKKNALVRFLQRIRVLGKNKKVLLVDEAHLLLASQCNYLKGLYDADEVHSIIISLTEKNNAAVSSCFGNRLAEDLMLRRLTKEELKEILGKRLNGTNPLHEQTVDYFAENSKGNPRNFLLNCKKTIIKLHEFHSADEEIMLDEVKKDLGEKAVIEAPQATTTAEETAPQDETNVMERLTPLQRSIVSLLSESPMSLTEISVRTGSSIGTVGKQLSLLCLNAKKEYMERKGVTKPLICKEKDNGYTIYSLSEFAVRIVGGNYSTGDSGTD
ncbi:MAG: hypothetical protein V1494_08125 [Candidatus Diapherotrites archaeon]